MSESPHVTIREAQKADLPAIRKLLPRAFRGRMRPVLFAALDEATTELLGAAAVRVRGRKSTDRSARFLIRVAENSRRRGIGTALLQSVIALARREGAASLALAPPVDRGTALERLLVAAGFRPALEVTHFEADMAQASDAVEPAYRRLEQHRRIPAGARVAPLKDAPAGAVRDMVLRQIGGRPMRLGMRIQGKGPRAFSPGHSVALFVGEKLRGVALTGIEATTLTVFVLVVDAALRGGWAHLLLLHWIVRNAESAGVNRLHFAGNSTTNRTVLKMARRTGADVKNVRKVYSLNLNAE